jgi:23S rRNA (cytosine1962-C5)-methyltransferase
MPSYRPPGRPSGRPPGRPPGRSSPQRRSPPGTPLVRKGTLRLPDEIAGKIRAGHPWIYREALGGRPLREKTGEFVEIVDGAGAFVGRALYEEDAILALRVVTRAESEAIAPSMWQRRVAEAIAIRRRVLPTDLEVYRLINAESDGIPGLTVDRYGDFLVAHVFTPALVPHLEAIYDELVRATKAKGLYEQKRFRSLAGEAPRGGAELVRGEAAPVELEVKEGELKFAVDPTSPVSTGLFLDLREGRRAVQAWSSGRRVLNLFSYTGAISVYAQKGGAKEVVSVDVAAKAHARARRNFALNGFDPEKPENIVGDAQKVLGKMAERGRKFDLVVMDPPAFGTAGQGKVFSAVQDYRDLVADALAILDPGGLLVAVSSTHKISAEEFDRVLADGAVRAKAGLRIIERRWLPPDFCVAPGFPEGNYLKFTIAVRS